MGRSGEPDAAARDARSGLRALRSLHVRGAFALRAALASRAPRIGTGFPLRSVLCALQGGGGPVLGAGEPGNL